MFKLRAIIDTLTHARKLKTLANIFRCFGKSYKCYLATSRQQSQPSGIPANTDVVFHKRVQQLLSLSGSPSIFRMHSGSVGSEILLSFRQNTGAPNIY